MISPSQRERAQRAVDDVLALLRGQRVTIPSLWNARALCDQLAEVRNRPIRLVPGSRFGWWFDHVWIAGDHADFIVWADRSSPVHQRHGILHEIGHMVLGHHGVEADIVDTLRHRFGYGNPDEVEAECFATTAGLLSEAHRGRHATTLGASDLAAADRLAKMVGTWT